MGFLRHSPTRLVKWIEWYPKDTKDNYVFMWRLLYLYSLYFIMDCLSFQVYWVLHLAKIILICSNKNKNKKREDWWSCKSVNEQRGTWIQSQICPCLLKSFGRRWDALGVSKCFLFYLYASSCWWWANISWIKIWSYWRHDTSIYAARSSQRVTCTCLMRSILFRSRQPL